MNWVLRFVGIVLVIFSCIAFFLPSPYWWFSVVSFVTMLGIVFVGMISDIASTTNKIISKLNTNES